MKKLILIGAVVMGLSGVAFAASSAKTCDGAHRFTANLNLDPERAAQVEALLKEYKTVKTLAMSGKADQIPEFIETKNIELALILTEEEMAQFKQNVSLWAESKDFSKFKMMDGKAWGFKH